MTSWTFAQIEQLQRRYPDERALDMTRDLEHTPRAINQKAREIGLKKSAAYYASTKLPRANRRPRAGNTPMNDLATGTSPAHGSGGITLRSPPGTRPCGPQSAPPDLLHFVQALPVSSAVRALGLSAGTISRLRHGYWPPDSRKVVKAWGNYKARHGVIASSWFMRRVRAGGVVHHAGRDYTALELAARTGQLLAVARDAGGQLVAQTLELPAERLALTLIGAAHD